MNLASVESELFRELLPRDARAPKRALAAYDGGLKGSAADAHRKKNQMRAWFLFLLLASSARADTAIPSTSPPTLTLYHKGRGILIKRGSEEVYLQLPPREILDEEEVRYLMAKRPRPLDIVDHGTWLELGPSVAQGFSPQATWSGVEVHFERELGKRALTEGKPALAVHHFSRAFERAREPPCHVFARDSCDLASLTYLLALSHHAAGEDERADALLQPLAKLDGVRLYSDLVLEPLTPLLELPSVRALRAPGGRATLTLLDEVRALVSPRGRVAFLVPEARSAGRDHPGAGKHVRFEGRDDQSVCENNDYDWFCQGYALRSSLPNAALDRTLQDLGFAPDPGMRGPRLVDDSWLTDLPSARMRIRRSRDGEVVGGCISPNEFIVDFEVY